MATHKIRLLDSDVISNMIQVLARSGITARIDVDDGIALWTSQYVVREVTTGIKKAKKDKMLMGSKIKGSDAIAIESAWKAVKKILTIRESSIDNPWILKGLGEKSLISLISSRADHCKIVSNNFDDVAKLLADKALPTTLIETPFEFYEESCYNWFNNQGDLIKFMILSNSDFRIIHVHKLGNIASDYRWKSFTRKKS